MIKKVILVSKTHFDFGFTDLAENVLAQYCGSMLRDIIASCTGSEDFRFVFTLPAWPLQKMLEGGAEHEALSRLVREGRVAWHALPFTSQTDFNSAEEIIESLRFSRSLSEAYGLPRVVSAKLTDVPGHGVILPALLAGAGVKFLHLGCNEYPIPPDVPELFFWESPDGSRVLVMYCRDNYGSSELMPEGWPFPVWMSMMHTHDNDGPLPPEEICRQVAEAREKYPGVEITGGTMDDFYRELSRCDLSGVPVIRKDLADTWIHGVGSYPAEVAVVRETRRSLSAALAAAALAGEDTGALRESLGRAWENLILFGEHTWGLDVKTWMKPDRAYEKAAFLEAKRNGEYDRMELSWQEQADRAHRASQAVKEAFSRAYIPAGLPAVLNPNGSAFTGWASLSENGPAGGCKAFPVFSGRDHAYVKDVPPLSIRPLEEHARPLENTALLSEAGDASVLENHRYRLRFDKRTGIVAELYDKAVGAPLLAARDGCGVFSYQYDTYGSEDVKKYLADYCYRDSDWGVLDNGRLNYPPCDRHSFAPRYLGCHEDGGILTLRYAGTGCGEYGDAGEIVLRIALPPLGDEVFVELALAGKQETPFIESGSIRMPLAGERIGYAVNKNGVLLDPAGDIADGANHVFYCLEAFACAAGGKAKTCVVAYDTPLMSIGETGVYTYRQRYEEREPVLYFDLFNNMWGTNYPQWMGGDYTFRFALFGAEPGENVTGRALSLYQGAMLGDFPAADCLFDLPPDVQVSRLEPLDGGILLRLRDTSGAAREMEVRLKGPGLLWETDLQNRRLGEPCSGGIARHVGAYGLLSVWAGQ